MPGRIGLALRPDQDDLFTSATRPGAGGIATALPTSTLLEMLCDLDEAPWSDLRGQPLDSQGLARLLDKYDVESRPVRFGDKTLRGYRREDLHDAWLRTSRRPR